MTKEAKAAIGHLMSRNLCIEVLEYIREHTHTTSNGKFTK